MTKILLFIAMIVLSLSANALTSGTFRHSAYSVCFTPGEPCTDQIVRTIQLAKSSINIQAYGFTSAPIAKALIAAKKRGVKIFVLLDKSNVSSKYSISTTLRNQHIPFLIDYKPAIAHNKVMIIDVGTPHATVITGSFNFTGSAQKRNAENLIIIHDSHLATLYMRNFKKRKQVAESVGQYCRTARKCKNFEQK